MTTVPLNDILFLAQKLISIPSVTGDIDKSIDVLQIAKKELSDFSFTPYASNGYPSLLYTNTPDTKQFKIILNAHLDIVPGLQTQFRPYVQDGKLYGRGAYDMKAAAAVMVLLYREVAETLPFSLGLQITTDEESGGLNGTLHQVNEGVRAEFVITGESGSNFRIIHESKGMLHLKLISKGVASHSAYPWRGRNAIIQMYQALEEIHKIYPPLTEEKYQTSINITHISTPQSSKHTVTPDVCEAILDVRYLPNEHDSVIKTIRSIMPEKIGFEILLHTPPHVTDSNNEYIHHLKELTRDLLHKDTALIKQHATSDARHFTSVNCAGVEFGPVGYGQHDDNEWVDINSLENYYKILQSFLKSLEK